MWNGKKRLSLFGIDPTFLELFFARNEQKADCGERNERVENV